jgi:hypothetical protein
MLQLIAEPAPTNLNLARSWSALHNALFPTADDFPPRTWQVNVAGFLFERGYDPQSIRLVLDHGREHGSFECLAELSFCEHDREVCEGLLPWAPDADWSRLSGTVELGAGSL